MTKLLEKAIERVKALPEQEQDAVAELLLSIAESDASGVPIDSDTRAAILEGLAQAERGEFVPDEVVAEANKRHGIRRFATHRRGSHGVKNSRRWPPRGGPSAFANGF
jgi:hypothetical protein